MTRRAVGIVRVSQVSGREGESFASPGEQRDRLAAACKRDGLTLLRVYEELDVSGGAALSKRPGLSEAVAAVEAGEADVIVAAYFDRLVRSLKVQAELIERVEHAGGQVMAVDVGRVTGASAGQWLSSTMIGAVSEYQRRATTERSAEAVARAVARGVLPYRHIPPGLRRRSDGALEPDATIGLVRGAYEMRAGGATIADIRTELARRGLALSYIQVRNMLKSRVYLGELHYGRLPPNLTALEPTVDRVLWQRVQRLVVPRGRRGKSDRLLARLGVLICGSCGRAMVVGTSSRDGHIDRYFYRCGRVREDCPSRMNISAEPVEEYVSAIVRDLIAHKEGRASAENKARELIAARDKTQEDLSAALRAFAGLEDEEGARERLLELRQARDEAQAVVDQLGGERAALTISAADWDHLGLDERRDLIRATIERVVVEPGRGVERLTVVPFVE